MDTTKQSPAILSLCTGLLRGLERGIEHALQTELRTIAYVEIETFIVDNLLQGMEKGLLGAAPIWTNLKTFPYRQFHGKIFGITGGYPCQPFSVAGKRGGGKDPRHLWPYIRRITESTKPLFCFFENVEGHLNLGFEEVSRDLRKMGYRVEAGIYSAEECGAPHQRKRLFILAIRPGGISQLKQFLADSNSNGSQIHGSSTTSGKNDSKRWKKRASSLWISGAGVAPRQLPENKTGSSMADSNDIRYRGWDFTEDTDNKQPICEGQRNNGGTIRSEVEGCGSDEMANTSCINDKRDIGSSSNKEEWKVERERQIVSQSLFPSRPGEYQFNWEHPRVSKPGLGITIDGYNFREDLLRGAGNGVVWQQAAFAFSDLLSKF